MFWKQEWKPLIVITAVFMACFYMPTGSVRFDNAILESLYLVKWYAREHVLLCLVPAFFIAGAISVFVGQSSVMKYLGAQAGKVMAYSVASVSGSILAVCSCTVLPLFAGIYRMGAGLGPATAFLYSGPAINVLAFILTARVLGFELGVARAVGAVLFSLVIGLAMHFIFLKEESDRAKVQASMPEPEVTRPLWQNAFYFASMVAILVFANWGLADQSTGLWFFNRIGQMGSDRLLLHYTLYHAGCLVRSQAGEGITCSYPGGRPCGPVPGLTRSCFCSWCSRAFNDR